MTRDGNGVRPADRFARRMLVVDGALLSSGLCALGVVWFVGRAVAP